MWEDSKTRSKWVMANQCYFPSDLPEVVGRPSAPESNEVNSFCDKFLFFFPCVYAYHGSVMWTICHVDERLA